MADNAKWYVAHTYSGYENTVKATIEKYVENRNMHELIHEISIPLETVTEITDNGPKDVERKVFPGYVLVKMVMNQDTWYVVRNTRGVTGFVGPGSDPTPLSEEEMMNMGFQEMSAPEVVIDFEVGDMITVIAGALKDTVGAIRTINKSKKTVTINVDMLGRETPVELNFNEVKKM